jgi:hypothetical protein
LDYEQPRLSIPTLLKFRCYYGLAAMERKLRKMLTEFRFAPLLEVAEEIGAEC